MAFLVAVVAEKEQFSIHFKSLMPQYIDAKLVSPFSYFSLTLAYQTD